MENAVDNGGYVPKEGFEPEKDLANNVDINSNGAEKVVAINVDDTKRHEEPETFVTSNFDNKGFEPERDVSKKVRLSITSEKIEKDEAGEQREGWGNKIEFILAIIGYAVGLGNVWRFPYLAQKNGGGAFLIPYIISLVFMGIPLFFLELAIGQRKRKGPLHVWDKLYKPLSGMGISAVVASFLVGIYYNMIVAWCFYYFFISFQKNVPYSSCPTISVVTGNLTKVIDLPECTKASKTTYYYYHVALDATETIDESGGINWRLALCLLLAWIIIFAITCKGVESMGKAVYFTALFPYFILIIFFIRSLMLPGAGDGIKHMFTPDFKKLARSETWLEASTQIFYSLGLSFGGLISMASYNDLHNNVVRDAILVSSVNCGTSVFAGVVIFGILGYKANNNYNDCLRDARKLVGNNTLSTLVSNRWLNSAVGFSSSGGMDNGLTAVTIGNITCDRVDFLNKVASGPGLTFIAFTEAMSTMAVTQLWSILFFMMLLTLGIGSMLGTFEAVRTSVVDLKILPVRMEFVSLILCTISYLVGLIFCQRSGEYWLQLFDTYSANVGLLSLGLLEIIVIMYIYGSDKFEKDVKFMLGKKLHWYWKITLKYIAPVLCVAILIATIYGLFTGSMKYKGYSSVEAKAIDREYPPWAQAVAIILMLSSVIFLPIVAILVHFDKFHLPGFDEGVKVEQRRRSSVIPMHPGQARRESAAMIRRVSRISLGVIQEDVPEDAEGEEEEENNETTKNV